MLPRSNPPKYASKKGNPLEMCDEEPMMIQFLYERGLIDPVNIRYISVLEHSLVIQVG